MGTNPSPLLDFDRLLAPIPGPDPAGSTLPYLTRERLESFRREINPNDYDPSDPQRPSTAKAADWPAIVDLGQQVLRESSKDLSVAARLAEALVKEYRLVGLRDGLRLLRLMVERCWERLSPALEEGDDLEVRAAAFRWLDDPDRGASFPSTLRAVPLVLGDGAAEYGWLDWRRGQDPRSGLTPESFDKARRATPVDSSRDAVELLAAARAEFDGMVKALKERMGESAPAMLGLRQAFDDCQLLAQQILQLNAATDLLEVPSVAASDSSEVTDARAATGPGSSATARRPVTRAQIYAQLTEAANALRRLEPHSPIPYLLDRAVTLGGLPFPALMRELIRDANVLTEMSREIGLKEGSSD